jgi:putative endonuclease
MAWTVYVLQSEKDNGFYVGCTNNLNRRVEEHNSGQTVSIQYRIPFKVIHIEEYTTQEEAYIREKQIKKYKGGDAFKKLIGL